MNKLYKIFDYHVHESHSSDAPKNKIKNIIKNAELKGIEEIAFTTHFIINGPTKDYGIQPEKLDKYVNSIYDAQEETNIRLKVGLEVDYIIGEERNISKILDEYPFDFILGSVHSVEGINVASLDPEFKFIKNRSISQAIDSYFNIWKQAIESGLFDVMAHPDYFKKALPKKQALELEWKDYGIVVFDAIDALKNYNVGYEVNTSSIRHGVGDYFPHIEFMKEAYNTGVKKVTIGSDSHTLDYLGFNFLEAIKILKHIGYTHISTFKNRRSHNQIIEEIIPEISENQNENYLLIQI